MFVLLKDRIEFFQWKIQSVDITPESPDILLQSFQAHQPRSFHIESIAEAGADGAYSGGLTCEVTNCDLTEKGFFCWAGRRT